MTTPAYNCLFGHPIYSDVGVLYTPTFGGGAWLESMPLINLQDRRLARAARSVSAAIADTRFRCDLKTDRQVRAVALPKHSLSSAGKVRVLGVPTTMLFDYEAGDDIVALGGTFTRAPTATVLAATYVDSNGVLRYAGENRCLRSDDFNNASWTKSNVTIAANSIANPYDQTVTADTLTASAGNGTVTQAVTTTAVSWTFSVWLKRKTGTGQVNITMDGTTWVTMTLTTNWTRFQITQIGVAGTSNPGIRIGINGDAVYAWGAQAEIGTAATSYVPTTSATNGAIRDGHFIGGIRHTLLEAARTNLALRSEQFDNATWTKQACTATADQAAAPDGNTTAEKLVPDNTGTSHDCNQLVTHAAVTYTLSVFAKPAGNSWILLNYFNGTLDQQVAFNVSTGATPTVTSGAPTATLTPLANGWYRCSMTYVGVVGRDSVIVISSPTGTAGGRGAVGDNVSGSYVWGAQLEAGAFASSYIPTTSAAVTRGDDFLKFPLTSVPQAQSAYVKATNLDVRTSGIVGLVGNTDSGTGNYFEIAKTTAAAREYFTGVATDGAAFVPTMGDVVEVLGTLSATAVRQVTTSINGVQSVGAASGTSTLAAAWTDLNLYVNGGAAGFVSIGFVAYQAIRIAAGVQTLAYMQAIVYDSGWLNQYPSGATAETLAGMDVPHVVLPASTQAAFRYCSVQIDDTANANGYVDIGRLMVTAGWQPTVNMAYGAQLGLETETARDVTDGGAAVFTGRAVRRNLKFTIADIPDAEALGSAFDLQRIAGTSGQLFFVFDPTDTTQMYRRAFAATLRELTAIEYPFFGFDSVPFALVEEL